MKNAGFLVEPAGVEPASKHMPDKLSTCLFRNWISENSQNRTNLLFSYPALIFVAVPQFYHSYPAFF